MKLTIALLAAALAFTGPAMAQGVQGANAGKPAAGAKAGDVWVNGKTYHCPGSKFFGTTKAGAYQPEKTAQAAGVKGARGKTCAAVPVAAKG